MRNDRGFSLIELLIVVAIILIIAAIAIPSLLQARLTANEASATASIRTISTAETAYTQSYGGYAPTIAELGGAAPCVAGAATACLIDNALATAIPGSNGKSGYVFAATGIAAGATNVNFVAGGTPVSTGSTGNRNVCTMSDGVLRYLPSGGGVPVTTVAACQAYPIAH